MKTSKILVIQRKSRAFTLFEVLIALAVFMLAVVGIATALDVGLGAVLEVRESGQCRSALESRLAYCQADPPQPGPPRVIEADKNHGIRVEERLEPFPATNSKGAELTGLMKLTITTKSVNRTDTAEILMNRQ